MQHMESDEATTSKAQQVEVTGNLSRDQQRLANVLSNLPGMAYRCRNDRDWTMEFVSDGCEALTGYKPADLLDSAKRSFNSLIHPDDRDRIWSEVQDSLSQQVPFRITYRITAADGTEKWVYEQGGGIFMENRLEALEGVIIDITGRKEAEARLQAQQERFQAIIESSDAGYFRIGLDGCYQNVNPAWLRMHGFTSREQIVGQHFSVVQVAEDAGRAEEIATALMRGGSVSGGEFSRLRRDGTVGYHSFSANPVLEGDKVVAIEGFLIDTTERRQAQDESRRAEQRYRALFDSMHEGVALHKLIRSADVPTNYRLLDVNHRYEQIVGVRREEVVNQLATEVYRTAEAPYLREFAAVFQAGSSVQFETYFPPMQKHFGISVAPMGDDVFATIFFDITEQKRTELQYTLISENAEDVIWLYDLTAARCVYISPSVKKLRGLSPDEVMAQSLAEAMPPIPTEWCSANCSAAPLLSSQVMSRPAADRTRFSSIARTARR